MGYFENVKKNFGFGCMRLPMKGGEVDYDEFCRMIDLFMRFQLFRHGESVSRG